MTAAALQARRQCAHVIRQNAPRWRAVQVPLPTPSALAARGLQQVICFCFPRWQRKQGDRSVNKSQACHRSATSLTFYSSMRSGIHRHLSPGQVLKPCPAVALAQISPTQRKSSVKGNSRLGCAGATFILPGVWPICRKRVSLRLSASYELTGGVA